MSGTLTASRLRVESIAHHFGEQIVLSDVTLALDRGEVVVVIGPNGVGKSTLLRILAGIMRPRRGTVWLGDTELRRLAARSRARHIGLLSEAPDTTFGFTTRELVLLGRYPHLGRLGFASRTDMDHAEAALDALQLTHLADRPYPTLSSGERQRVGIARLVCQAPPFMLLDEPTSRLDPAHALEVVRLLRSTAASGQAVLAVVHDLDLAAKLGDRLVVLAAGAIRADGPPGAVLTPELIETVWGVRARRVDGERPAVVLDPL